MYECECGHTFTRPLDRGEEHSESSVCPLCHNDRFEVIKTATDMLIKCETIIAVWEDFYTNWSMIHCFTAKQRIDRHVKRLQRMRNYYLQQLKNN